MNHCCEQDLVSTLLGQIQAPTSPWDIASVGTEFDYRRGRADVVAVSHGGTVVAFEAKMNRRKPGRRLRARTCSPPMQSGVRATWDWPLLG